MGGSDAMWLMNALLAHHNLTLIYLFKQYIGRGSSYSL
jgi:hypothetical protein